MSEPYKSTKSLPCVHLKTLKLFYSVRRPEAKFKHAQGHQRAGALTFSVNLFQSPNITVYEVEHQKTLNTNFAKRTKWFSEVIKEFYEYFQKNTKNGRYEKI